MVNLRAPVGKSAGADRLRETIGLATAWSMALETLTSAGALPLEGDDGSAVQRTGCLTLESIARMNDDPRIGLPVVTR